MGYYSRHSIFLLDNDRQKLELIQKLLGEEDVAFDIREETVYLYDGEALTVLCVSDEKSCVTMGRTHLSGTMCLSSIAITISPSLFQGHWAIAHVITRIFPVESRLCRFFMIIWWKGGWLGS